MIKTLSCLMATTAFLSAADVLILEDSPSGKPSHQELWVPNTLFQIAEASLIGEYITACQGPDERVNDIECPIPAGHIQVRSATRCKFFLNA